jgi:hypothetical protein
MTAFGKFVILAWPFCKIVPETGPVMVTTAAQNAERYILNTMLEFAV